MLYDGSLSAATKEATAAHTHADCKNDPRYDDTDNSFTVSDK